MNTDRLGIELFPAKQKKTDEKKKLENWRLWKEWTICPLISQFISCQKKVIFLEYSSLRLF